jgi:hypothetical protein
MTRKKKKKHSKLNSKKLQAAKTILQEEQSAKRKAYLRFQGKMAEKSPKAKTKPHSKPKKTSQSLWQRLVALFKSLTRRTNTGNTQKPDRSKRKAHPEDIKPYIQAAQENLSKIKQLIADWETKQSSINAIELPVFEIDSCSNEELGTYRKELEEISKELRLTLEEEESKRQKALSDSNNQLHLWQGRLATAHQHNAPPEILTTTQHRVDSYAKLVKTLQTYGEEFARDEVAMSKSIEDIETRIQGIKEAMLQRQQEDLN